MSELVEQYDDELSDQITKEVQQANLAENALLGLIFKDDTIYASAGVSEDWFQTPTLRTIYKAMGEILGDSKPVDVITVSDHLGRSNPRINWLEVCVDITRNGGGVAENLEHYVDIIRDSFTKRRAREIADKMLMTVHNGIGAVDEAIRDLMDLGRTETRHEHDMPETLKAVVAHIEQSYERAETGGTVGITTGMRDLDDAIGGWHPSDLYVIAARPAMGKTAGLLNLLLNSMSPFGMLSSEQAFVQVGMRMMSIQGLINGNRLRRGKINEHEWTKISSAVHLLRQRTFWINDQPDIDINDIRRQARKWKYANDVKLIGVDYIQRLKGTHPRMPEREKVMEVTRGLKSLAKELDIPIIALAQVNRSCEARPDKRPQMGDIAESSIVEMEADGIACLYRDEVYYPDTPDKGVLEWIWHKNRHGPTGVVRTHWQGEFFKVSDFAPQHYQDRGY